MELLDYLFLIAFVVIYPIYSRFSYLKAKQDFIQNKPGLRSADYRLTSFWLLLLFSSCLLIWLGYEREPHALGFDFADYRSFIWLPIILIIAAGYFLYLYKTINHSIEKKRDLQESLQNMGVIEYMPKSREEFQWFVLVSISAGIAEETLFRGYLFWVFEQFGDVFLAIICSSLLFGLAHSYQGWKGILRTAMAGVFMAVIYWFSGSLWIPILVHILGDIYGGLLSYLAFQKK